MQSSDPFPLRHPAPSEICFDDVQSGQSQVLTGWNKQCCTNGGKGVAGPRRIDRNPFADGIEVDNDEIRVCGLKPVLERGVIAERLQPSAVPSFVPKWRCCQTNSNSSLQGQKG